MCVLHTIMCVFYSCAHREMTERKYTKAPTMVIVVEV